MCQQRRTTWSRDQIRSARRVDLAPLLRQRGFALLERSADNYTIREHPGIIVKQWYWNWPEQDKCGNTIDFLVDVLGMSFSNAMREILDYRLAANTDRPLDAVAIRPEGDNLATNYDRRSAK